MEQLGNVTVLERPMRITALVSAVRAALRARQRQYETRTHLSQIEASERDLRDFFDNATVGLHWVGPDAIEAEVRLFDVYTGTGVAAGKKSLAITIVLQPEEATLTDAALEGFSKRLVAAVEKATGGTLRS